MTGIVANPNLDEKAGAKAQRLRDLEDHFKYAIDEISGATRDADVDFKEDPFFAAMKLPDIPDEIESPTEEEIAELERQQKEMNELREDVDQG